LLGLGLYDDVVGLGYANTELIDRNRFDRPSVGRDDGHRQPGDAYVHKAHRRAVDDAQPHLFARSGADVRLAAARLPVHQQRVVADVCDIGRVHAHLVPGGTVRQRFLQPEFCNVTEQLWRGSLREIVIARIALQIAQDPLRRGSRMLRQKHDFIAVRLHRDIAAGLGIDDQRAVLAFLLLGG